MRISLVTPLYNSASHLEELTQRAITTIQKITEDYEIIFVNDGSPDESYMIAKQLAENNARITLIDLSRNFGQHPALMTGLGAATGDYIFICDSDLEEEPEWIGPFFKHIQQLDADVVFGVQTEKKGSIFYRAARSIFYSSLNLLSGVKFPHNITTARLMSRRYLDAMLQYKERELFAAGIWHMTGFKQVPYPVAKPDRSATTYKLSGLVNIFVNAVTAFSTRPLKAISLVGILISVLALCFIAYLVYFKFFISSALPGWTSVMATTLLLGGIILFFNGIMAIYLAKIFTEVKQRPLTTVREVIGGEANARLTQVPLSITHTNFNDSYMEIISHYENCLSKHKTGAKAVDWKNEDSANTRYEVMLGLIPSSKEPVRILDFGCGLGGLKTYIDKHKLNHIEYEGLEISKAYAKAARKNHPGVKIHCLDILKDKAKLSNYDYIVLNGIFTRRENMSETQMLEYLRRVTEKLFPYARHGIAFNVMSQNVDWKSNELFHPSNNELVSVISKSLSPHFVLRNDYGLYETTCYVYQEPTSSKQKFDT